MDIQILLCWVIGMMILKDNYGEHCFDPFINDDRFYFTTRKNYR